jgi:hypothetical protein
MPVVVHATTDGFALVGAEVIATDVDAPVVSQISIEVEACAVMGLALVKLVVHDKFNLVALISGATGIFIRRAYVG